MPFRPAFFPALPRPFRAGLSLLVRSAFFLTVPSFLILCGLLAHFTAAPADAFTFNRNDAHIEWRTSETEHFRFHYPAQLESVAGYIAGVARVLRPGGRFRFQYAHRHDDDLDGPLHWTYTDLFMAHHAAAAGLAVEACDRGRVFPQWTWVTAIKERV